VGLHVTLVRFDAFLFTVPVNVLQLFARRFGMQLELGLNLSDDPRVLGNRRFIASSTFEVPAFALVEAPELFFSVRFFTASIKVPLTPFTL
jgi:hypothetical protein